MEAEIRWPLFSRRIFWNGFSWIKFYYFCLRFHGSLFLKFELMIFQHWFRQWLVAWSAPSHYLNQCWLVYWRIYASLGLIELNIIQHCLFLLMIKLIVFHAETLLMNIIFKPHCLVIHYHSRCLKPNILLHLLNVVVTQDILSPVFWLSPMIASPAIARW